MSNRVEYHVCRLNETPWGNPEHSHAGWQQHYHVKDCLNILFADQPAKPRSKLAKDFASMIYTYGLSEFEEDDKRIWWRRQCGADLVFPKESLAYRACIEHILTRFKITFKNREFRSKRIGRNGYAIRHQIRVVLNLRNRGRLRALHQMFAWNPICYWDMHKESGETIIKLIKEAVDSAEQFAKKQEEKNHDREK